MAICNACNFKTDNCGWNKNCEYQKSKEYLKMLKSAICEDFTKWNFSEEVNYGTVNERFINTPECFIPIEISDGKLIDAGYYRGGNWYFNNFYMFICFVASNGKHGHYWRYTKDGD